MNKLEENFVRGLHELKDDALRSDSTFCEV